MSWRSVISDLANSSRLVLARSVASLTDCSSFGASDRAAQNSGAISRKRRTSPAACKPSIKASRASSPSTSFTNRVSGEARATDFLVLVDLQKAT